MVLSKRKGKISLCLLALCLVLCSIRVDSRAGVRDSVEAIYLKLDGIIELTGHNDGPMVREVLATCGLKEGYPYCAATVNWAFEKAGIETGVKSPAWSPSWFVDQSKVTYKRTWKKLDYKSKKAQVFGLYFHELKRVAHVGFIMSETTTNYLTFEGNTNAAGSREGDGFHKKIRSKKSIFIIADYLQDYEDGKKDWRKGK